MSSSGLQNAKTQSTATFITALWLNGAIFGLEILAFTILRKFFVSIYEPRTKRQKIGNEPPPTRYNSLLSWPWHVLMLNPEKVMVENGMDAYFFVRFLFMMFKMLFPIWIVSWAVLFPLTAVKAGTGKTGLDKFTFGNVAPNQSKRYIAHIILAFVFTFWILYIIYNEMKRYVVERQKYLCSPSHRMTAQARTVLITGIKRDYLSDYKLRELFDVLPGGVEKVWLNRDLKDLPTLYEKRLKACKKLESAETTLLRLANKRHTKLNKTTKEPRSGSNDGLTADTDVEKHQNSLASLVPDAKRPSHRLPLGFLPFALPLMGKKVDSIHWAREEVYNMTSAMENHRSELVRRDSSSEDVAIAGTQGGITGALSKAKNKIPGRSKDDLTAPSNAYPALSSAFILFRSQIAAHLAVQAHTHHRVYNMSQRYLEIAPEDVIWGNLGLNTLEIKIRRLISWGITIGLIVLWAFPVAFVGAVSNVANLCSTYKWLAWLCTLPKPVIGILQGILPPVLLAVLMMLLPIVLRLLAKFEGTPTRSAVELSLMTRYFLFQVIHSFLIVTLSSGIIAALPLLVKNPSGIPSLLASSLPQASNFFLTYVILQGLTGTASGFLQIATLVVYYIKLFILGSTPRSVYNIKYKMGSVKWGTLFPATTLVAVITIAYSIISPIINGLACATFGLFYLLYKYLFTYTFDQPRAGDSGALYFPKAIQHIFVGLYIQQVCLAGLFFLAQDQNNKPSAIPEGALMVILIVLTIIVHIIMNNAFSPLINYVPLTFKDGIPQRLIEEERRRAGRNRGGNDADEELTTYPAAAADPVNNYPQNQSSVNGSEENLGRPKEAGEGDKPAEVEDFAHPASVEKQQVVWIPRDPLNLYELELEEMSRSGVAASTKNAIMDNKGHVDVLNSELPPERAERIIRAPYARRHEEEGALYETEAAGSARAKV